MRAVPSRFWCMSHRERNNSSFKFPSTCESLCYGHFLFCIQLIMHLFFCIRDFWMAPYFVTHQRRYYRNVCIRLISWKCVRWASVIRRVVRQDLTIPMMGIHFISISPLRCYVSSLNDNTFCFVFSYVSVVWNKLQLPETQTTLEGFVLV